MNEKIEFTEDERKFLQMLFTIGNTMLEAQGGDIFTSELEFSTGDLYSLSQKIGVNYY